MFADSIAAVDLFYGDQVYASVKRIILGVGQCRPVQVCICKQISTMPRLLFFLVKGRPVLYGKCSIDLNRLHANGA